MPYTVFLKRRKQPLKYLCKCTRVSLSEIFKNPFGNSLQVFFNMICNYFMYFCNPQPESFMNFESWKINISQNEKDCWATIITFHHTCRSSVLVLPDKGILDLSLCFPQKLCVLLWILHQRKPLILAHLLPSFLFLVRQVSPDCTFGKHSD